MFPQGGVDAEPTLISVIVLAAGSTEWLCESLQSVYSQSHLPHEVIICEAAASDNDEGSELPPACAPPSGVTTRVVRGRSTESAILFNRAIEEAKGEFVSLLVAGDLYTADRLALCLAALRKRKNSVAFSAIAPLDASGQSLLESSPWWSWYRTTLVHEFDSAPSLGFLILTENIGISVGNLFFRRDLFAEIGPFEDLECGYELDFLLKAARREEPVFLREPSYRCRLTDCTALKRASEHRDLVQVYRNWLTTALNASATNPLAPSIENWPTCQNHAFDNAPRALLLALDSFIEKLPDSTSRATSVSNSNALDGIYGTKQGGGRSITVVSHELSRSGAPTLALQVCKALSSAGAAVNVISLLDGPLRKELELAGIAVTVVHNAAVRMLAEWSRTCAELATRQHISALSFSFRILSAVPAGAVALSMTARALLATRGTVFVNSLASWPIALPVAVLRRRTRVIWYIHESHDPNLTLEGAVARRLFRAACKQKNLQLIFGSDGTRSVFARLDSDGEVRYWSGLARDESGEARKVRGADEPRTILSIGTTGTYKGTRILLEAFAHGRSKGLIPADVQLVLIGCRNPSVDFQMRDLLFRIIQLDLLSNVRLIGSVAARALPEHYARASLYVQSSIMECLPLAILTAMQHGLPIVTTDVYGCKEAIIDEECGLTVPPRDFGALAHAIGRIFNDPELAERLGAAARNRFDRKFSYEVTAPILLDTILGGASNRLTEPAE